MNDDSMCHENVKCLLEDDEESDVGFSGFDCECFCNYNGFQCSESGDTCEGELKTLSMPRLSILHELCIKLLDTTDTFMYVSATCNSYTPQLQSHSKDKQRCFSHSDIDECGPDYANGTCFPRLQVCINTYGGYICVCLPEQSELC